MLLPSQINDSFTWKFLVQFHIFGAPSHVRFTFYLLILLHFSAHIRRLCWSRSNVGNVASGYTSFATRIIDALFSSATTPCRRSTGAFTTVSGRQCVHVIKLNNQLFHGRYLIQQLEVQFSVQRQSEIKNDTTYVS